MPELPRIAQLLGVDPRAERKAFVAALDRELAQRDKTDPQAAAQLQADERLLNQAMKDGKIIAASRPHWLKALREDRNGAKACLAVMAGIPFIAAENANGPQAFTGQPAHRTGPDIDPDMARISAQITGRPLESTRGPQSVVQAAAQSAPPRPVVQAALNTSDQPFATTSEELDAEIMADSELHRAVWAMGARGGGLDKPPERVTSWPDYEAPWNPKPRLVMNADGTGQWETPLADYGTPAQTDPDSD